LLSTEHELFITFLDYLERGILQEKDPSTLQNRTEFKVLKRIY